MFINKLKNYSGMAKFINIISIVILVAALVLLFDKLFTPQPIQIVLSSGQEITTSTAEYFTLADVLLLVISAFLIGTTATYLFYNSDRTKTMNQNQAPQVTNASVYNAVLPLLKAEEKLAVAALKSNSGEMQQNKLAEKLGVSKVKISRILFGLEQKRLIKKERNGLSNKIKLEKGLV
jgi:uncharacterized membrane protein